MKSTAFETYVPLGLIESVQVRDLFQLVVNCKDASTVRCSFQSADQCLEWQRRIQLLIGIPETLETLFAFPFYSWTCDDTTTLQQLQHYMGNQQKEPSNEENAQKSLATTTTTTAAATAATSELQSQSSAPLKQLSQPFAVGEQWNRLQRATPFESDFMNEVARLGFDLKGSWRISTANTDFKLCPSYPQKLLVPCCITDEMLHNIANFRGSRRLPAVVWRHQKSGAILARCSQPEVGWLGWRNYKDEQLLKALADACAFDRGEHARRQAKDSNGGETAPATAPGGGSSSGKSSPSLEDSSHEELALDEIKVSEGERGKGVYYKEYNYLTLFLCPSLENSHCGCTQLYVRSYKPCTRRRLRMHRVLSMRRNRVHELGKHSCYTQEFPCRSAAVRLLPR